MYATIERKSCPMFDEKCVDRVINMIAFHSNEDKETIRKNIEEKCGRFIRGKHIGQLRGWAHWSVVVRGGWLKDGPGYMNGHVVRPGTIFNIEISDFNGKRYL